MDIAGRIRDFTYWRSRHLARRTRELLSRFQGARASRTFAPVDPRIRYPSYKDLDEYVDVERLRSLDGYVTERVMQCLRGGDGVAFDTGPLKVNPLRSTRPGSRVIELTSSARPFSYFDLDDIELWKPTPEAQRFSELMDFVATLPFEATARIIIMCDDRGRAVTMHRDHAVTGTLHEFMWFRTNLDKPFYVTDRQRRERLYLTSHSAWFDTVNQFHGADAAPHPTISMRVDGRFEPAFRERIPRPPVNPASTPSYWATVGRAPLSPGPAG